MTEDNKLFKITKQIRQNDFWNFAQDEPWMEWDSRRRLRRPPRRSTVLRCQHLRVSHSNPQFNTRVCVSPRPECFGEYLT